jgi:hypothetical protein
MHMSANVLLPALRTARRVCSGNDNQTQRMMNCILSRLLDLAVNPNTEIRAEACWTISVSAFRPKR